MGAQLRVLRRRIRSVESTKKITRAQELIAASRIVKAQGRLDASRPYFQALVRALSAAVSNTTVDHPLLTPREAKRAAVVVFTADRGFAGAYSANTIREARALLTLLEEQGMETDLYVVGQKGIQYFTFRGRQLAGSWSGFTEEPQYTDASVIGDVLIESFLLGSENGGVDQIHGVGHLFINRVNQQPTARRILPIEVQVQEVETTVRQRRGRAAGRLGPALPALRVRAVCGGRARQPVATLRALVHLLGTAARGGVGARRPAAGDEVGHRQRRGPHQDPQPAGQPGSPGRDHPGDQRDRRRR
jgi:F-type H+-transporting ATPase subunit gamma